MNIHTLKKLEFKNILELLESKCLSLEGKKLVTNLEPSSDKEIVQKLLDETLECSNLVYKASYPSILDMKDILPLIAILKNEGILSITQLIELQTQLNVSSSLKSYFEKDYIVKENYPILADLFDNLYSNKSILDELNNCISTSLTISDGASLELNRIRKSIKSKESRIKDILTNMIHSPKFSKYIQESIITIRNDRFVIPIKEEFRGQIKGFIHDISNAGSTLFIEPLSIFEINNDINKLKLEEDLEIEKILYTLSSLFYPYLEELSTNYSLIGKIDFIFAKAKLSNELKCITPKISKTKSFNLINARHPLLNQDTAVPISITLGNNNSMLLITGPNTGGKTVTLKTVGLLHLMACSGLNIPCDENSSVYIFDNIFTDIGDEQNISDSLSTFSSHILNISNILNVLTSDSLVLLDELRFWYRSC